jgi:hypothetical protein
MVRISLSNSADTLQHGLERLAAALAGTAAHA